MKGRMAISGDPNQAGHGARRKRPFLRLAFWTSGLLALAFTLGFGIFSSYVSAMMAPAAQRDADAIVVLTGGQARIDAAIELLKSGKGKRLLISGVNPVAGLEDLRRATGAEEALFACCVDIDRAALDTIGNAEESARWMQAHAYASVILVTNNYHMPRSMLEMRRAGNGVEILPHPVVNTRLDRGEWLMKPQALRVLFTEYTKYLAALVRGAVEGFIPAPASQPLETAAAG
jgi:uncharacterized SAM-binding protein YcdF (DUF218 family)